MLRACATLGVVAAGLLAASACARFEPEPLIPSRFQFEQGAHEQVPCESCHPDDPATAVIYTCTGTAPSWNGQGCLQCHECDRALHPSGANHYPGQDCVQCHALSDPDWAAAGGGTGTGGGCGAGDGCHGVVRADGAPSDDAHGVHLDDGPVWLPPGSCEMCHPPGGATAATHDNGTADLPFDGISVADPKTPPSYTAGTCANTYCHGAALPEGGAVPSWAGGGAEADCGTCHGIPPDPTYSTIHAGVTGCNGVCHNPTADDANGIGDPSTHIDGTIDP